MNLTDTIETVLRQKGKHVWSVDPTTTVYDALALMADLGIGALVVLSGTELAGLLSERDYARKVILQGRSSKDTLVEEIMTSPVVTVTPQYTVDDCMRLMTDLHIRHLPVLVGSEVVGVVSIGDLVKWIMDAQRETIDHLSSYISGGYPA